MKDNKLLLRVSQEEMNKINDLWFALVVKTGERMSRSEAIRVAINFTLESILKEGKSND